MSPHLLSRNSGHTRSPSAPLGSGSAGVAADSLDALSSWRSRRSRFALVRESQRIGISGGICSQVFSRTSQETLKVLEKTWDVSLNSHDHGIWEMLPVLIQEEIQGLEKSSQNLGMSFLPKFW